MGWRAVLLGLVAAGCAADPPVVAEATKPAAKQLWEPAPMPRLYPVYRLPQTPQGRPFIDRISLPGGGEVMPRSTRWPGIPAGGNSAALPWLPGDQRDLGKRSPRKPDRRLAPPPPAG